MPVVLGVVKLRRGRARFTGNQADPMATETGGELMVDIVVGREIEALILVKRSVAQEIYLHPEAGCLLPVVFQMQAFLVEAGHEIRDLKADQPRPWSCAMVRPSRVVFRNSTNHPSCKTRVRTAVRRGTDYYRRTG